MKIGIVTSPTGAAIRDMINVAGRRFPAAEILLYPALVQGTEAPEQLAAGLTYFNRTKSADVIIIGRGGGSIEDLWAFNDERLARAVAASEIPVISAVGHETDFTICDFAADVRAPTPSAAAELAVPDTEELQAKIRHIVEREADIMRARLGMYRQKLNALASSRAMTNPTTAVDEQRIRLDALTDRMLRAEENRLNGKKAVMAQAAGQLGALNPLAVLSRGYSAVYRADGALVKRIGDVSPGDRVVFRTVGGEAACTVDEIMENNG